MSLTEEVATRADARVETPMPAPTRRDRARLILLSFLMLFLELALIRWTAANVVYLSFFTNFVLSRYFWLRIAPVADSRPTLPMN